MFVKLKFTSGNECNLSKFGLSHNQPWKFYSSEWFMCTGTKEANQRSHVCYVAHRIFWAVYLSASVMTAAAVRGYDESSKHTNVRWMIYWSYWSLVTINLSSIFRAIVASHVYFYYTRRGLMISNMTWWLKASWFAYTMTSSTSLAVTVFFWSIFFLLGGSFYDVETVHNHLVSCVYTLIDLSVTAMPTQLLHFWIPLLFGIIYVLFSVMFEFLGGSGSINYSYIYPILDWKGQPHLAAIIAVSAWILIVLGHLFIFTLSKLRSYISEKWLTCAERRENDVKI